MCALANSKTVVLEALLEHLYFNYKYVLDSREEHMLAGGQASAKEQEMGRRLSSFH